VRPEELAPKHAIQVDVFAHEDVVGLPAPVARYLRAAIAPGTPLVPTARLTMRGAIKLGKRWLPLRARQVLAPHGDSVWSARVAGIVSGADRYADGSGTMQWKLFGLIPIVRAGGPDVSRSSAGRFGSEAMWVPTSLLPRFGVTWTVEDDTSIKATFSKDGLDIALHLELEGNGLMRSMHLDRWGDATNSGKFGLAPFGVDVTDHGTFDGLTIPRAGRGGWFHGTDRWDEGEFFRYEITALELVRSRH
jgi:hypothetical protein